MVHVLSRGGERRKEKFPSIGEKKGKGLHLGDYLKKKDEIINSGVRKVKSAPRGKGFLIKKTHSFLNLWWGGESIS